MSPQLMLSVLNIAVLLAVRYSSQTTSYLSCLPSSLILVIVAVTPSGVLSVGLAALPPQALSARVRTARAIMLSFFMVNLLVTVGTCVGVLRGQPPAEAGS